MADTVTQLDNRVAGNPVALRRSTMRILAATGFAGMLLLVAGTVFGGPTGPTGGALEKFVLALTPHGTIASVLAAVTVALGLVLVAAAWLGLGLVLREGAPVRQLARLATVWSLPLLLAPPLFSRDAFSYAALGRMVNEHFSPYDFGPGVLGSSPFTGPVSAVWMHTRSPYGPLFIGLSGGAVRFSGGSVLTSVLFMRLIEVAGVVMLGFALPKLAQALGKDPARAFWLGVCNPLVLVHFIGGAHNDALMMGLLVSGLAVATLRRPGLGIALCMFAAAVKAPAAVGAAFIFVDAIRTAPPERRLATFAKLSAIGIGTFSAITMATGVGWGWVKALGVPGTNVMLLTPTTFLAKTISAVVGHDQAVLSATRGFGTLATIAGVGYLLWRSPKIGMVRACGLALAVVVAFGPIVLPWYALWPIIVLAAIGNGIERRYAIFASVVLLAMVEPSGSIMPDPVLVATVIVLIAVAVVMTWAPARRWIREDVTAVLGAVNSDSPVAQLLGLSRPARPDAALTTSSGRR